MKKVWRMITIYGKEYIFKELNYHLDNRYDEYNLEYSNIYLDRLDINDPRIQNKNIFDFCNSNFYYEENERWRIFEQNQNINKHTLLYVYKRFPLSVFFNDNVLSDKEIMEEIVHEYPILLYSLIKEKYQEYFSFISLANFLIINEIYPIKYLNEQLIQELFKNEKYKLNFIYHFIIESQIIIYDDFNFKDNEEVISKVEVESIEIILPYLYEILDDEEFVVKLINKVESSHDLTSLEIVIYKYGDKSEKTSVSLERKKEAFEQENEQAKIDILKLKYNTYQKKVDFDTYVDQLMNNLYKIYYNRPIKKLYILNAIPHEYIENKDFLIAIAKKGFAFSYYSKKYKEDEEVLFEEIKQCKSSICTLNPALLKKNFILKVRSVCPQILFYVDSSILNDFDFMIDYIKHYSVDNYFILGDELSKNKKFFFKAVEYDSNILFYCSYELREDATFMSEVIRLNRNSMNFLGIKLRQNMDFIMHFLKMYT